VADFLIALGILVILGVGVTFVVRKNSSREERRRAKAISDANGRHEPLSEEEREHADAIHEIVQEARTGDLPKYRDERRPTVREVARKYRRPAKHSAKRPPKSKVVKTALDGPIRGELAPAVMLPGPTPAWDLESFTGSWTTGDLAKLIADAKAGASL